MDTNFFTPEIRADVDYLYDFNHPKHNTISGSSEVFRANNEVQVTQLGVGGDFHYDNVRAAASGTPYFTQNPGDPYKAWDVSGTLDWMPSQYITFRWEYNHRAANVPYFSGSGGVTPPGGNTFGAPGSTVCFSGAPPCGSLVNTWFPDLRKTESRLNMAILVKF